MLLRNVRFASPVLEKSPPSTPIPTQHCQTKQTTLTPKGILAKVSKGNSSEQGMSLLECLIAIVVVTMVITFLTPPIFIAVATRIQNRRAEQAIQLAQGEVDRVRRTVERGSYEDRDLPPQGGVSDNNVKQQAAPSSTVRPEDIPNTQSFPSSATQGLLVDVNGDGSDDFIVQTYRTPGVRNNTGRLVGFNIGVRVYTVSIRDNWGLVENPPQRSASLKFSTALGQQQRRPLALMYTSVVRSDARTSLQCYHEFLGRPISGNDRCNN
ncbi:MAG TPA: prepilin-type N-terminal cleavage/methylation domain-containing protein [Leptolyngbyaceae cyanobacterium]